MGGLTDEIRVFITTSTGELSILRFLGGWRVYGTGLTVAPKSSLTTFGINNSTGITNEIYVYATNACGSLVEMVWNRDPDYRKFLFGRTVDTAFNTTQANAAIGSVYGTPDTLMRVYYIGSGVMEHRATLEGNYDPQWLKLIPSEVPDTPGGAVAGLAWANTEVRVYYMAGGVIHEIGLTEVPHWRPVRHIQ
ncbi:MAG: hypothetical protein Q9177_006971 [Variospora cf. flavescens]